MTQDDLENLTAVRVAKLLDVTDRAVRKWCAEKGLPCNSGSGVKTFRWKDVLKWWVDHCRNEGGTDGTEIKVHAPAIEPQISETYDEALARKTRAEADIKELQLAEKRALVASLEDVERVVTSANLATRTQIEAVPARLALQLVGVPDRNTAFQILNREMSQLMTNLSTIGDILSERSTTIEGDDD